MSEQAETGKPEPETTIDYWLLNDSDLYQMKSRGLSNEQIICALCKQKAAMLNRILERERLRPTPQL